MDTCAHAACPHRTKDTHTHNHTHTHIHTLSSTQPPSCQTYEGGFGGEPGLEAHGGYAFCAFAALVILGRAGDADLDMLEHWLAHRQMSVEGGFQGRTNKLVDGCYGFWQGGTGVLLALVRAGRAAEAVGWRARARPTSSSSTPSPKNPVALLLDAKVRYAGGGGGGGEGSSSGGKASPALSSSSSVHADDAEDVAYDPTTPVILPSRPEDGTLGAVNQHALQKYLLHCCQQDIGGLRDKPGKGRDFYHTCYVLSGLAAAQHGLPPPRPRSSRPPEEEEQGEVAAAAATAAVPAAAALVYGDFENLLPRTNPVYNLTEEKAARALDYFYGGGGAPLPCTHEALLAAGGAAAK